MGYYPVFFKLDQRPCVVVGGGRVAERKVLSLREAGARVKVISPRLTTKLKALAERGEIEAIPRPFTPHDLEGAFLAIAATNLPQLNRKVAAEARERGILVNVVDDPGECDFIVPSMVRRGELVLAISTGGNSPALARKIREELEKRYGEEFGQLLGLVAEVRRERPGLSYEAWRDSLDGQLLELLRQGRREEAKARLVAALGGRDDFHSIGSEP